MKILQNAGEIVDLLITERIAQWNDVILQDSSNRHCIDLLENMVSLTADTIGLYTFSERFCGSLSHSFHIVLTMLGWKIWQDALLPFVKYIPTPANVRYWFHLRELKRRISKLIQNRLQMTSSQRQDYHDVLSLMLIELDNGTAAPKMNITQLRDECIGLVFAGHDTTASTLSWIFYTLAEHPNAQDKVRKELENELGNLSAPPTLADLEKLKFTGAVIKEVLRLYPPATIGRTSLQETKIGEHTIPAGSELFLNIYAMHRSKRYWGPSPDEFDPERFMRPQTEEETLNYLPFGGAPRSCVGMRL